MKINFNSFSLGRCGGTRFIFELSNRLVDRGYQVTITHAGLPTLHDWFSPIKAELIECNVGLSTRFFNKYVHKIDVHKAQEKNLIKAIPDCDVNVATFYDTAKPTVESGKGKLAYLVQHYEPNFFADGSYECAMARASYDLPLMKLCVSQWLTGKVRGKFIGNGINLEKFRRYPISRKYDVMVIPNPTLKYKGNYDPIVKGLRKSGVNVLAVSNVSEAELVKSYNLSSIMLFLSEQEGFGYPPLEAMACGANVVSTPCTEYFVGEKNCLLLPKDYSTDDVVSQVKRLIDNKHLASYLVEEGYSTAQQFNFDKVVDRFVEAVA